MNKIKLILLLQKWGINDKKIIIKHLTDKFLTLKSYIIEVGKIPILQFKIFK